MESRSRKSSLFLPVGTLYLQTVEGSQSTEPHQQLKDQPQTVLLLLHHSQHHLCTNSAVIITGELTGDWYASLLVAVPG